MEAFMKRLATLVALLLMGVTSSAEQRYPVSGMVVKVNQPKKTFVVSCQTIPGYMSAMVMPFQVRDGKELDGLTAGATVDFTLVVEKESNYADQVQARAYQGMEQDPATARRLRLLRQLTHPGAKALSVGQAVPDFSLTDQVRRRVTLSRLAGKVVAINFIYTSCALPNFCFRNSNNFGVLQRRFKEQMGKDLVLLTVTFDPQRDQPDVLAHYAKTWKADAATWHFLTGSVPDIQRVSRMFGVDYFPDEGLMNHSLHTAIIDRQGKLVANIEGNQFSASQLGDLVQTALSHGRDEQKRQTRLAHNEGLSPDRVQ
jgi:protein SCO1